MEAHNEEETQKLYANFESMFERAQLELSANYGQPVQTDQKSEAEIPLNGIVRLAIWKNERKLLYLAFAHEDRGCPILLVLGTVLQ